MLNYTNILFDNENLSGAVTGAWMTPVDRMSRAQIPVIIDIVGTASVQIEGADITTDSAIALTTAQSASIHLLVDSRVNIRAHVLSATSGAKVRVTVDGQLLALVTGGFASETWPG